MSSVSEMQTIEREFEVAVSGQQCSAWSKQAGRQCANRAIPGGNVCRFHGGAAPQVREAAARRIGALRDLAMDRLEERLAPQESSLYEMDPKVLVEIVDKFTKMEQLLTGNPTERTEQRKFEDLRLRFEQSLDRLGNRLQTNVIDIKPFEEEEFIE